MPLSDTPQETWLDAAIEPLARRVYGKALTQIEAILDGKQTPFSPERLSALAECAHAATQEIPGDSDEEENTVGF